MVQKTNGTNFVVYHRIAYLIFGIAIMIFLSAGCDWFWQIFYSSTVNEYNHHISEGNKARESHNILVKKIRDAAMAGQTQEALNLEKEYLGNLSAWRKNFEVLISFIEVNHGRLRKMGVNPDYAREDVKSILNTMQENEVRYRMDQILQTQPAISR
jgi:hypothetical protein